MTVVQHFVGSGAAATLHPALPICLRHYCDDLNSREAWHYSGHLNSLEA